MCFVTASVSGAATIEYTDGLPSTSSNCYYGPMDVAQFNPELGILTSATLTITGAYSSELTGVVSGNKTVIWNKNSGIVIQSSMYSIENTPAVVYSQATPYDVKSSYSITGPELTLDKEYSYSTAASLEPFIGNGALYFFLMAYSVDMVSMNGQPSSSPYSIRNAIDAKVKVIYSYTPAPLPSALIFLISGLAAVVGFKRFKAARD